jgi:CRISPR-associated protein Cmr2
MSDSMIYTAVTFAPVQGFIEKSRKLRDLYGSSYLLSFIAQSVCLEAKEQGCEVISPALPKIAQGLPNQIIIEGRPGEANIRNALMKSWQWIVKGCQEWIEDNISSSGPYTWNRDWNLWSEHAWEFFYVEGRSGESISQVRQRLNEAKRQRAWTAINWQGESSTLSGADAVAYPDMANVLMTGTRSTIERFYEALSRKLGEAIIDPDEELSIPELVKRLITHSEVIQYLKTRQSSTDAPPRLEQLQAAIAQDLVIKPFTDLNRKGGTEWTGWFMGDGDGASDYLKWVGQRSSAAEGSDTQTFSHEMREWGAAFKANQGDRSLPYGRVIYAGGDDFLGVMYRKDQVLAPKVCLEWLSQFKSEVWDGLAPGQNPVGKITASVGFVWASPQVPQRDVLQHARSAEASAKKSGKDRVAIRVLFAGGNHLEWGCPWWILEAGLFEKYRDRNGVVNALDKASWTHFYNDVAVLESRHAFGATLKESTEVAIALFRVYFPAMGHLFDGDFLDTENAAIWNQRNQYKVVEAGILGEPKPYQVDELIGQAKVNKAINEWVINLAKVGFYLCSNS